MKVGIINYMKRDFPTIERKLTEMGHTVEIYDYTENHYDIMLKSDIKHWFFTGSPMDITSPFAPQLDKRILGLNGKRVFLICYSMESILGQLGCKLVKHERNRKRKLEFDLLYKNYLTNGLSSPIDAWRNHETFIPVNSLRPSIKLMSEYNGKVMTAIYRNAVMTQWHPEHTEDGRTMISNWLNH